jgi:hypothetical protein
MVWQPWHSQVPRRCALHIEARHSQHYTTTTTPQLPPLDPQHVARLRYAQLHRHPACALNSRAWTDAIWAAAPSTTRGQATPLSSDPKGERIAYAVGRPAAGGHSRRLTRFRGSRASPSSCAPSTTPPSVDSTRSTRPRRPSPASRPRASTSPAETSRAPSRCGTARARARPRATTTSSPAASMTLPGTATRSASLPSATARSASATASRPTAATAPAARRHGFRRHEHRLLPRRALQVQHQPARPALALRLRHRLRPRRLRLRQRRRR